MHQLVRVEMAAKNKKPISDNGNRPEAVSVRNLHKSFGDLKVLKGISMTANEGDVVSVIGSSGSGKSTFLRCINLLEKPSQGEISVAGEPFQLKLGRNNELEATNKKQLQRLRSSLAMVFQNFNLWQHMTVMQNVMEGPVQVMGLSKVEAKERAEAILDRVGMADKHDAYPGFLSGGQQQRAAIARALAMEPKVMLFDEPTSALDPELVGEVLKVIQSLAEEGRTMILVTHEMKFARDVSSHVMYLHEGKVEEEGPPKKVFYEPVSDRCREFVKSIH